MANKENKLRSVPFLGVVVINEVDEILGTIKDLSFDENSGDVLYVIIEIQSLPDMAHKHFAMPWNILIFDDETCCFRAHSDDLTQCWPLD